LRAPGCRIQPITPYALRITAFALWGLNPTIPKMKIFSWIFLFLRFTLQFFVFSD
jgi:hypothetical protein